MIGDDLGLLLSLGITDTEVRNIPILATSNLQRGRPIGQGKCKAVRLYLNNFVFNTQIAGAQPAGQAQIYCGTEQECNLELIRSSQTTWLFIVSDLNKVFVRGNGLANDNLFAIIYK